MIDKNYKYKNITAFFALVILIIVSCERDIPKDAEEAGRQHHLGKKGGQRPF